MVEKEESKSKKEDKRQQVKRNVFKASTDMRNKNAKGKTIRKRKKPENSSDESDVDSLFSVRSESSIGGSSVYELTDDQVIKCDNYVLVQFPTKSTIVCYVGRVLQELGDGEYKIKFLRKKFGKNLFFFLMWTIFQMYTDKI